MRNACLIIIIVTYSLQGYAQDVTLQWARSFGNVADDYGISIAADTAGNVYTLGTFVYSTDFDPGAGVTLLNSGGIFILKQDKNSNLVWAKSINTEAGSSADFSIVLDKNGNIYYGGVFSGTVDFDPGAGVFNMTSSLNGQSAFISRLDANGNFVWADKIDNASIASITVDASGNVYSTGSFEAVADFDPGPGVYNLTEKSYTGIDDGDRDIFVLKLDTDGNFVWAKQMGGVLSDVGIGVALDGTGNVLVTGQYEGVADFDPGPGIYNLTSAGGNDIFAAKLTNEGNFVWAKSMGGSSEDYGRCVTTDSGGNVYLSGYFYGTADFDPGPGVFNLNSSYAATDVYVSKLDANGNFIWAKEMGGPGQDQCLGLSLDAFGNVYTTGSFSGVADFDPGPATFNLTSNGYEDIFISKLDNNGNFVWAKSMGSADNDDVGRSIFVDGSRNIYTTGWFWGTADFDPEAGVYDLTSNGLGDIFIQKLSQCLVTYDTLSVTACNSYTLNSQQYLTSGTYIQRLTNSVGCDSILTLDLQLNGSNDTIAATSCNNYTWQQHTYSASGFYRDTLINSLGCDSILNLNLTINQKSVSSVNVSICEGSAYYGYTLPGTYTDTLIAANGCDSIRKLFLIVNKRTFSNISATICEGENYEGYTQPGIYSDTLVGSNGCDSIRIINLIVHPKGSSINNVDICEGQSYFAGGAYRVVSGVYIDSMHTVFGCDSIVTTNLTVNPKPTPNLGEDRNLCSGQSIIISPGVFNTYLWQDGSTSSNLTINNTGIYWVYVTDQNNCSASDTLRIMDILPLPYNFLKSTDSVCNGGSLEIMPSQNYSGYLWSTGSNQAMITIQSPGTYSLNVTDNNGCKGSDSIIVFSKNCNLEIYIPNAFTPNGDGLNDIFRVKYPFPVKQFDMVVYDRWGEKVFETNDINQGWDGTWKGLQEPQSTYVWVISYTDINNNSQQLKGTITLLR